MSYQKDRMLSLRWYVGLLGIGLLVWSWFASYIILLLNMKDMTWVVEWLTYGMMACAVVVVLIPSGDRYERKTRQEGKVRSNTKKYE